MTSLARETGCTVDMDRVRQQMTVQLSRRFGMSFEALDLEAARAFLQSDHI